MLYTIYKRTKKSGSFFYVTFYDEKTMKYGTAKSVDTLARELGVYKGHITKRPQAEEIVRLSIESGLDGTANKKTLDSSFVDYCLKFWDYDSSEFIQILNATNPGSIGRDYAHGCLLNIKNHVATVLPKDLKCSKVSAEDIERVQHKVLIDEKRSPQTWSNVLNSMRRPINELRRKKVLKTDPLFDLIKVRSVANKVSNVGALTQREVNLLITQMFNDSQTGRTIVISTDGKRGYSYSKAFVLDRLVYLATTLSACTGMRMGEILGLHVDNIRFVNKADKAEGQAIINVCQAYARETGMKLPKAKKGRQVPCPLWLAEEMVEYYERANSQRNGLIFQSAKTEGQPIDHKRISQMFNFELDFVFGSQAFAEQGRNVPTNYDDNPGIYKELIKLGEKERKERNIHFHSMRHYFNSQAVTSNIGTEEVRLVMGHESSLMTERYFNVDDEKVLKIGQETTRFVNNPRSKEA